MFYKQPGPLGITTSKLFINNSFYKQSVPRGITPSKLFVNNRFYKQSWHRKFNGFAVQNNFSAKTIFPKFQFSTLANLKKIVSTEKVSKLFFKFQTIFLFSTFSNLKKKKNIISEQTVVARRLVSIYRLTESSR